MELHIFLTIFIFGIAVYFLSTRKDNTDPTNTYQFQLTFLSLITWAAMAYNSFNIQIYSHDNTLAMKSFIDYTLVGLSIGFLILSLLNLIILGFVGSWTALFNRRKRDK
ncbi:MAG: hypothetical protein C3F06_02425 [Candidatus Methanoperedenaceae archaeon]|nr:MAG: hypothetical protein C3F06_02425 [Candidatus Methanoperedenaceae archaeon]